MKSSNARSGRRVASRSPRSMCRRMSNASFFLTCRFRILDSSVPMVQPAKDRMRNNVSGPLDWARVGRVLPERNVSSPFVIVGSIFCKNSSKVLCVENYQMVKTFASDRPDQAFNIAVLPGRAIRGGPVPNAHRSDARLERDAKCSVIVADEIARCAVPRERFGNLARQPFCRWVLGHRKPQQLPPAMAKNKKCSPTQMHSTWHALL